MLLGKHILVRRLLLTPFHTALLESNHDKGHGGTAHNYTERAHDGVESTISREVMATQQDSKGYHRHFLSKLHRMLSELESQGLSHIVWWKPHGRGFQVHMPNVLVENILPTCHI